MIDKLVVCIDDHCTLVYDWSVLVILRWLQMIIAHWCMIEVCWWYWDDLKYSKTGLIIWNRKKQIKLPLINVMLANNKNIIFLIIKATPIVAWYKITQKGNVKLKSLDVFWWMMTIKLFYAMIVFILIKRL